MARPTIYSKEIVSKVEEYLNLPRGKEYDEVIPSIEGLALYIGIARSTIYEWAKDEDKAEFSDIIEKVLEKQGQLLINNGLSGDFAPTITKVILSKHDYREGIDQSVRGFAPSEEHKALADKAISTVLNDYERDTRDIGERK